MVESRPPPPSLVETLAFAGPERERLVEADDAIRDCAGAVEAAAERDGLDGEAVSRGLVGVLLSAGARQWLKVGGGAAQRDAFLALAGEAYDWAAARGKRKR